MESLPDDNLLQILQIGTRARRLDHIDLCSLTIVNSRFDQLTQDTSLWATLLSRDFPSFLQYSYDPSIDLYRKLYIEKKKKSEYQMKLKKICSGRFSVRAYFLVQAETDESFHCSASKSRIAHFADSVDELCILCLHEASAPALSYGSHPNLRQDDHSYEKKPSKRFYKSSKPKVIPMSKSYIPMNRPPRKSMPRKI